jgi:hypothetical protein
MYYWGSAINYTPAPGIDPFLGGKRGVSGSIGLRPSAWLDVEQIVLHDRLSTIPNEAAVASANVFTTGILRSQATLQVTKGLALRGVADFNKLFTNPALFAEPPYRGFTYDVLVRFSPSPGTALFLGFTERYENVLLDPRQRTFGVLPTASATPVGQRIFAKLSYLVRL